MSQPWIYKKIEPTSRMVRQELPTSCGAACVRQLLLDENIEVTEAKVRESAQFDTQFAAMETRSEAVTGIHIDALAGALNTLHDGARYKHGAVLEDHLDRLADIVPFIALLRTPAKHYVIVDQVGPKEIRVRDPAGTDENSSVGANCVMSRTVFLDCWRAARWGVIFKVERTK